MINDKIMEQVTRASRITLSSEEKILMKRDFEEVLNLFSVLDEIQLDEFVSVLPINEKRHSLREDIPLNEEYVDAIKLAKHRTDDYFKGPRSL